VRDVVEQRVHGEDDVGVVLAYELTQDPTHCGTEDCADRGEGRLRVARVIDRAPRRPRPSDDRRIEGGKAADYGRTLADQGVGDSDSTRGVQQSQRLGQCVSRRAMTATRVTEENEDARRTAGRSRVEGGGLRYFFRAAARRAIQRMLYAESR